MQRTYRDYSKPMAIHDCYALEPNAVTKSNLFHQGWDQATKITHNRLSNYQVKRELLFIVALVRRVWTWNSVRRPRERSRLLSMGIVIWAPPPWIGRLAILLACWLLNLWGWVRSTRSGGDMIGRWLLWCCIRGWRVGISRHCRLLMRLVVRCLGARMWNILRIRWRLRTGSWSLMGLVYCRIAVRACVFTILKT